MGERDGMSMSRGALTWREAQAELSCAKWLNTKQH
jgi:hypothetical protein